MWNPNYFYVLGQWVGSEKPSDTGEIPKIEGSGDYLLPDGDCREAYFAGIRDTVEGEDIGIIGYFTSPEVRKHGMRIAWIVSHDAATVAENVWPSFYVDIDRLGIDPETDYKILDPAFNSDTPFRIWNEDVDGGTWVRIGHS